MANRVWADLMGRGLVEPVDDLRATNPPSNAALLEALGKDFEEEGYDLKKLIRRIATSYVYGLSSSPTERNIADTRNYSRYYRGRLRAEVLLDAVTEITGVPESFDAMPPDSSAKLIWTHRVDSLFLDAFGRPDPNQDPPCERTGDTSIVQALHLMNSEKLSRKITSDQRPGRETRRLRQNAPGNHPRTLPANLFANPQARRAGTLRKPVRQTRRRPPAGGRRPDVGDAQHAGICV